MIFGLPQCHFDTPMFHGTMLLLWFALIALQGCISLPEHWTNHFTTIGNSQQIIVHFSRLGLANRLRTIADWYNISIRSQRSLVVLWEVTRDCQSKFSDLFVSGPPGLTVLDNDAVAANIEDIAQHIAMAGIQYTRLDQEDDVWAAGMSGFVLGHHILQSEVQVLLTEYDGILTAEGVDCQTYLSEHGMFLQQLQPNAEALSFSEDIYNTYFANSVMVGVHYRAHDPTQDWAVVPPLLGDTTDKVFGQGATVQDFVTQMHIIVASRQDLTSVQSGRKVRFFIASNSDAAKKELATDFPDAIFLGGEHRRDSAQGMQLALVEWLLLSRAALLLHTYGSTFAEQAALRGSLVPSPPPTGPGLAHGSNPQHYQPAIVGIWEGRLLAHTNPRLPFCGSQQYARAYSDGRKYGRYKTGANTDNAEVCLSVL